MSTYRMEAEDVETPIAPLAIAKADANKVVIRGRDVAVFKGSPPASRCKIPEPVKKHQREPLS
jgi:hypothetical protein